jgi:thioredoxin 2
MSEAIKLTCTTCGQSNRVPLARLADKPKCGHCGDLLVTGTVAELDLRIHDSSL